MTLDRTTFDAPAEAADERGPTVYLSVVAGAAEPPVVELPRGVEISIGRSRSSALRVDDGEVSRTHATVRWDGDGLVTLVDYGSRNGTLVDGRRVRGTERIASGAELRIGGARLVLVVGGTRERTRPTAVDDALLLAHDPAMLRTVAEVETAAQGEGALLLLGETGVGKEVLARRAHMISPRASGPFVAINCAAIAEALAMSTLFGHELGSFTGATSRQLGVLEAAHGGTLFLDEIGELSLSSQARLLRALEHRALRRVGGLDDVPADVRVVAATNADLETLVAGGRFREDLRYRIAVFVVRIPPLRERPDDILPLAMRFAREIVKDRELRFASDAELTLRSYGWPGNVRELRNAIERAALACRGDIVRATDLEGLAREREGGAGLQRAVDDAERDAIVAALRDCGGNQSKAATRLGISRRALIYRLERLGLKRPPPSERGD